MQNLCLEPEETDRFFFSDERLALRDLDLLSSGYDSRNGGQQEGPASGGALDDDPISRWIQLVDAIYRNRRLQQVDGHVEIIDVVGANGAKSRVGRRCVHCLMHDFGAESGL